MKIFSELEGFVIYDPKCLMNYISNYNLFDENLLSLFTETEAGDFVSQNGIIIPIIGVEPDYYSFEIVTDLQKKYNIISESKGWILEVVSNQVTIVGIGYLTDIATITEENSLSFTVPNGWYNVSIATHQDIHSNKIFLLKLEKVLTKPSFKANIEQVYNW